MLIYFGLGIAFFIFASAVRRNEDVKWIIASYWIAILFVGLVLFYIPDFIYLAVTTLPVLLRMQTRFWMGEKVKYQSLLVQDLIV